MTRGLWVFCALIAAVMSRDDLCAADISGIDLNGVNWASGGRSYDEQHFSPLTQITAKNVSRLGLAWSLDLPGEHNLQATPLAVDGVLYFTGQMSKVYAVNAATGKMLWAYDPETYNHRPIHQRYLFPVNRGVAFWKGKVFVGTLDGRLIAIDARTGHMVWSTMTFDPGSKRTISGAPRAYNDKVVIGSGGADYGERGCLSAYDASSGKQVWRFYTAPGSPAENAGDPVMEMAARTWSGEYWKTGTGGAVWNSITYDAELNRLYFGTANGSPYNPTARSPGNGDNLFLDSIVAVDADTGSYLWHYQVNPREAWDYDATGDIQLAVVDIDGAARRVLLQAPKNGFFYVIDRDSGKLISAEKTGKVTWAERVDLETGRPVETRNARYQSAAAVFWPGIYGTHNWQPMAYSPQTGLVYIPYMKAPARYQLSSGADLRLGPSITMLKIDKDDWTGALLAWDPIAQKARWSVPRDKMWNGGIASTAGNLVFQGDGNGILHAYDARRGASLWSFDAKLGISAAPITYIVNGRQYVSILVGFGGATVSLVPFNKYGWKYGAQPRRLLTFALDGTARLPPTPPRDYTVKPLDDPKMVIDEPAATSGSKLYGIKGCPLCHGDYLKAAGAAPGPDLRESGVALADEAFGPFLRSGALVQNGMPRFDEITDEQAREISMFIRSVARDTLSAGSEPKAVGDASFEGVRGEIAWLSQF